MTYKHLTRLSQFACLLLSATFACSSSSLHTIRTKRGSILPHDLLKQRLPHLSIEGIPNAIFESTPSGLLVSKSQSISPTSLAPHTRRLKSEFPVSVRVDFLQQPELSSGPVIRWGKHHTFMFDPEDGQLLLSWGPNFHLEPLHASRYPGVYINVFSNRSSINLGDDIHPVNYCNSGDGDSDGDGSKCSYKPRLPRVSSFRVPGPHRALHSKDLFERPISKALLETSDRASDWQRNRHDFNIFIAYDSKFCANNGGQTKANNAIYGIFKIANEIYRSTLVFPRLKHIDGRCDPSKDDFKKPKSLDDCLPDSSECSRPQILLESLRNYWKFYRDNMRRDAVYLFTGYEDGSDAIGAAYVGAACNTEYGYGWVENLNPIVLAHEIGHTLGAHHEKDGIMSPFLNLSQTNPVLSAASIRSIENFVKSIWSSWCLASWDKYYEYGDTTLVGMRTGSNFMDGTDITLGDGFYKRTKDLYILHIGRQSFNQSIRYSIAFRVHHTSLGRYRYRQWQGMFEVPFSKGSYTSGGGIAFANIRSSESRDLFIFYVRAGYLPFYRIGFGLERNGTIAMERWKPQKKIPVSLGTNVKCSGIAIGDILGNGNRDLVVVYVDTREGLDYAFYFIGWNIGEDGDFLGGWSEVLRVPGWFGYNTGDISVALWDTTGSGKLDVVVHSNEKVLSEWRGMFRVGRDLDENGIVQGLWSSSIPAPGSPLITMMPRVRGGITLGMIPGSSKATTVVLQRVAYPEAVATISYLEFGFDVVDAAQKDANTSFIENIVKSPEHNCKRCYQNSTIAEKSCDDSFSMCEDAEFSYPIETDVNVDEMVRRNLLISRASHEDSIFCTGFHELFIGERGSACRTDVGTEEVMMEGARSILETEMRREFGDALDVYAEIQFIGKAMQPDDNLSGPSRTPGAIRFDIKTSKDIRGEAVDRAMARLQRRADFLTTFDPSSIDIKVKREDRKMWVVIIKFSWIFRVRFYENDELISFGSE